MNTVVATAYLTVVHQTIINSLHEESETEKVIAEELAVHREMYQSIFMES